MAWGGRYKKKLRMFKNIGYNAKILLVSNPFWAIAPGMLFFYRPLYMRAVGLSEVEIGTLTSIAMIGAFIFGLLAGPLTNRFGRKMTVVIADFITWGIPMFLWAVADSYIYFFIAAIFNGMNYIASVAFQCALHEDTAPEHRATNNIILNWTISLFAMLAPVTTLFIDDLGMIKTMRIGHLIGLVLMFICFTIRLFFMRETQIGKNIMAQNKQIKLTQILKNSLKTLKVILKNKETILIGTMYILSNTAAQFSIFQLIFLNERLGYDSGNLSIAALVNSAVVVIATVILIPIVRRKSNYTIVSFCYFISAAISLLFIFLPSNALFLTLAVLAALSLAGNFTTNFRDSAFFNSIGENEKSDAFSTLLALNALINMPMGFIAGILFRINQLLPFIMIVIIFVIAGGISIILLKSRQKI